MPRFHAPSSTKNKDKARAPEIRVANEIELNNAFD